MFIIVPMYIETMLNRSSSSAILQREGWREGKKVRKRTLVDLTAWPGDKVATQHAFAIERLLLQDVPLNYPGLGGSENPLVRADMVFFETPRGSAVFSTCSIAFGRTRSRTTATPTTSPGSRGTCSAALSISRPWTRPC
jgi:hypothetical protein